MAEEQVGVVVKFFSKPSVAAVQVMGKGMKKGDLLHYKGHTTDFTDQIVSLEVDNKAVDDAKAGDLVGIKVKDRVRENDKVYRVEE
ncbi:MAG: translation elongation factor-like protein [Thermodesulfobacteriota bacterium]